MNTNNSTKYFSITNKNIKWLTTQYAWLTTISLCSIKIKKKRKLWFCYVKKNWYQVGWFVGDKREEKRWRNENKDWVCCERGREKWERSREGFVRKREKGRMVKLLSLQVVIWTCYNMQLTYFTTILALLLPHPTPTNDEPSPSIFLLHLGHLS